MGLIYLELSRANIPQLKLQSYSKNRETFITDLTIASMIFGGFSFLSCITYLLG